MYIITKMMLLVIFLQTRSGEKLLPAQASYEFFQLFCSPVPPKNVYNNNI
jgi:hypothetical protein